MANIFDNLEFSHKVFLKVQYTTILEELNLRRTHGQIVRRLISEGDKLQDAELLYQRIIKNPQQIRSLADALTKEIEEQKKKLEDDWKKRQEAYDRFSREQKRQRETEAQNLPMKYMQRMEQENREKVEQIKLGSQFAADIILKFLGF